MQLWDRRRSTQPGLVVVIVLSEWILGVRALLSNAAAFKVALLRPALPCRSDQVYIRCGGVFAAARMQDRGSGGGNIRTPFERVNAMGQPMQVSRAVGCSPSICAFSDHTRDAEITVFRLDDRRLGLSATRLIPKRLGRNTSFRNHFCACAVQILA